MKVFGISDLHLAISVEDKNMDLFGPVWEDYMNKIAQNWSKEVCSEDIVIVPGDISWAMKIEKAYEDFKYIESLPGKKLIFKGNHDYWWSTGNKLNNFIKNNNPINVTNTQNFTGSPQLTGQTWESTKPSATPSLNKPTPIESNDDKQPYFVEPTLKETVSVDLNGDQQFDKFELYLIQSWDIIWPEGYPEPIYSDEKPYVCAIINDEKYELELIDGIVYGFKMMPFSLGNGNQAVAIEVDLGGSVGTSHLYVVAFSNNKLELCLFQK